MVAAGGNRPWAEPGLAGFPGEGPQPRRVGPAEPPFLASATGLSGLSGATLGCPWQAWADLDFTRQNRAFRAELDLARPSGAEPGSTGLSWVDLG